MKKLILNAKFELIAIINIILITLEFWNNLPIVGILHIALIIYLFNKYVK